MLYTESDAYAESHSFPESRLLQEIRNATESELEYDEMLSGKQVAGLLRLLILTGGFRQLLEVGMFTGYATLSMAEVLPEGGMVTTIEMNDKYRKIAERYLSQSPHWQKINILSGNARELTRELEPGFDLIFLDADKQYYPEYFQTLKSKLRPGGLFVVDNTLWSGQVLQPSDRKSEAIDRLNKMISSDSDFVSLMLNIRDGVMIARKEIGLPG